MKYEVDTYTLEYVEKENKYYISFKDSVGTNCRIEISKTIFNEYLKSRKAYIKIKNETSRHIEHKELTDEEIYRRINKTNNLVEDIVIKNIDKDLLNTILTEKQYTRIELHLINKISITDIAKIENVRKKQIKKSIELGIKKIKKFFSK